MKKSTIYVCVLCLFGLLSCQREEWGEVNLSKDMMMQNLDIRFDAVATKCEDSEDETFLCETEYVTESGDTLYISAYLSDMEDTDQFVETKSTLVNGANFGTVAGYNSFKMDVYRDGESAIYVSKKNNSDTKTMQGVPVNYSSSDSKWHFGSTYYWPSDNSFLNFCSYGPVAAFESCVSNKSWNKDSKTFSFTYTTPSGDADKKDAENQKDIVVGVNRQQYVKSGVNNISVSLRHPMLAVRFVMGDVFGKIEYLSLNNFYSVGTASVTSSSVSWSGQSTKKSFLQTYDFFDTTKYSDEQKAAGTVELDTTTGKTRNFIIIPQQLADDASMDLKMGNNLHPITLNFSNICKDGLTKDWTGFAGKILTFRVNSHKANLVSVDITDEVSGFTKQNIKIVNDGKSPLYIRAVLVGNWLNGANDILAPWSETKPYGVFSNSLTAPGKSFPTTLPDNWTYNPNDGFYYYKKIVRSGHQISQNLFDTFTLTSKPQVTTSSTDTLLIVKRFELDILVQAVSADTTKSSLSDVARMPKIAWNISDADLSTYFSSEKE